MRINHDSEYQRILKDDYIRRFGYKEGKAKAEKAIRQAGKPYVMDQGTYRKIRKYEAKSDIDIWRQVRPTK